MANRLRLLLVDDDEEDYVIVSRMLGRVPDPGYELDWEPSPDDALQAIAEGGHDAALIDYRLGIRDGVSLVREAAKRSRDTALIVLTGRDNSEIDDAALEAGAADFLVKGEITPTLLDRTLRYAIRQRDTERELRRARAEAEAASRAKDRFLAVLSHELRTPLTPILAAVTSTLAGDVDASMRPMLEMVRRNVELEARLVDDLLDVSRLQHGDLPLRFKPTDVHDAIRCAVDVCRDECRDSGLEVRLALEAVSHHANADSTRLIQVAWNLIRNAARFTLAGGTLEIRSRDAGAPARQSQGRLVVEFRDDGIGIPPGALQSIFEPFERATAPPRGRAAGLGLGLAIARAVTEGHGGLLTASSAGLGFGSTFRLELPTIAEPREHPRLADDAPPKAIAKDSLRILLVEDNPDTRRYLTMALGLKGHRVVAAASLEGARKEASGEFDVLVSDIELPDGTGLELMYELAPRGLPGIAISGFGSEEDVRASLAVGFSEHLTKPIDFNRLENAIRTHSS